MSVHTNTIATCTYTLPCTHTLLNRNWQPDTHFLTWKKSICKERGMWNDEVIVKHTPLYLYLPHTAQHKAFHPSYRLAASPSLSLRLSHTAPQSYMKGIRQARRAECRVTAANGVMARPDKHPASNEKALRLPSSPVTMQLLNRVIAR